MNNILKSDKCPRCYLNYKQYNIGGIKYHICSECKLSCPIYSNYFLFDKLLITLVDKEFYRVEISMHDRNYFYYKSIGEIHYMEFKSWQELENKLNILLIFQ